MSLASLRGRSGDPAGLRGLWVTFLPPFGVEALAGSGLDWIGLDLQHGDLTPADVAPLLRVTGAFGLPILVRMPSADPTVIARVLDDGPAGVIVPAVESSEQTASVVAAALLPPRGTRSTGLSRSRLGLPGVLADPLLLVMVETAAGYAARVDIAQTPGVDGVFVGPYDLALSLGTDRATDPSVVAAITDVLAATRAADRVTGYFAGDAALVAALPPVDLLAVDSDAAALRAGVSDLWSPERTRG